MERRSEAPKGRHIGKRNFEVDFISKLWPNNKVPYIIEQGTFGDNYAKAKTLIEEAAKQFNDYTCVNWVTRTSEDHYVRFVGNEAGCYTTVGYNMFSYRKKVNFAPGCLEIESVIHEMYHVVGGTHEVQRLDRSDHVNILWKKIKGFLMDQFIVDKATRDRFPYDYHSVMQYRLSTFPQYPNENTIALPDPDLNYLALVPKKGFSFLDIAEINDAYQCTESCTIKCHNGGFPTKPVGAGCKCHCPSGLTGADCTGVENSQNCGEVIHLHTGSDRTIKISNYQQGRECTWIIMGNPGSRIRAIVTFMSLPYKQDKKTCEHWLEFRDYHIGTPGKKLCGSIQEASDMKSYKKYLVGNPAMMMMRFNTKNQISSTAGRYVTVNVKALASDCVSSPCKNGAECQEDPVEMSYECYCENGFSGRNCEEFADNGHNFCDFSKDLKTCILSQDIQESDFIWTFATYICRDSGCNTGIYTPQSSGNQFLTIDPNYKNSALYRKSSVLITTANFTEKDRCLTFDYNMGTYSRDSSQTMVRVYRQGINREGELRELLWEITSHTNYKWMKATISIHKMKKLKIVLEAFMGSQELGIDNMLLRPGLCSETVCNPNPCINGGTCQSKGSPATHYSCTCPTGYTGINCEKHTACHLNPCRYGGTCTATGSGSGFLCHCPSGFSGDKCENKKVDPCLSDPCKNNGICKAAQAWDGVTFTCSCQTGYIGDTCEGYSCTFETEKHCFLTQEYGPLQWERHEGPTPSPSTGPMKAAEGRFYLYLEATDAKPKVDSRLFFIPNHKKDEIYCLQMHYSLIGKDIGELAVYEYDTLNWKYNVKARKIGQQLAGEWLYLETNVNLNARTYLIIQGMTGSGYRGDLAIDNVRLWPYPCP
ncbi:uncharacterized protein LOC133198953 isoform X2 [Saccostrea echinata]|uniref:uncharacterized protein LOC133198953 isoform X2 n=1 Tax=Saccostrea echinata TaxID=191078 RepID=UPI002A7ED93B|nr:uncharacterized protein LOC133198953 isoform X2 [Saccostrea echinata]